ncbi:hypothetical protein N7448_004495 [Penicillium atrosanguineum]|uniref:Uncharacterized protein n=1 Tax=Penicillium atrosanguineum TaxID=1132637 RepID=A0A9W9H1K5_9EURO|nr:uncharacterized protein N7443_008248 [Penicillium atrosanguineum]KAJ5125168.1 hypothetical protein N7526_007345 [Penicillium atrosanguineum]KAJ5135941.1 hypothetical protein N7448_004495 [Penicillium atrosanguineum]KAJ5292295.1 hypothetical protein N7443_008248 [Penicillium atrosanguineum]KAJ5303686.1 hypothetical protein N7476_010485 [Penicillium atrosanguineum]
MSNVPTAHYCMTKIEADNKPSSRASSCDRRAAWVILTRKASLKPRLQSPLPGWDMFAAV